MNKKIICDVNIWYRIAEGHLDPKCFDSYCLIASVHNTDEFGSSEELIDNPKLVKKAILAMDKYACEVLSIDPFDNFIKKHLDTSYISASEEQKKGNYDMLVAWAKGEVLFELKTDEEKEKFRNSIKKYNANSQKYIANINSKLPTIRTNKKYDLTKKKVEFENLQAAVTAMVYEILAFRMGVDASNLSVPLEELEFLIRAWTRLYRNVIVNKDGKLKTNDPEDKSYLAYVGKDDLFWSGDYKFLNKISLEPTDPEIEKFLFDKDRILIKR